MGGVARKRKVGRKERSKERDRVIGGTGELKRGRKEKRNVKMKKQEEGRKERQKTESGIGRSLMRADELISSCLF